MFDSSLAASGVGRESRLPCVSDGDECVLVVCSAIKAALVNMEESDTIQKLKQSY